MTDLLLRFLFGGIIISAFAALGDIFRPKSFAGLFGAAPSIALATLGLTIAHSGKLYAATEARSMVLGAIAFFIYASAACFLLMRYKPPALAVTLALLPLWLGTALALWAILLR
jgi:hypothetical protein